MTTSSNRNVFSFASQHQLATVMGSSLLPPALAGQGETGKKQGIKKESGDGGEGGGGGDSFGGNFVAGGSGGRVGRDTMSMETTIDRPLLPPAASSGPSPQVAMSQAMSQAELGVATDSPLYSGMGPPSISPSLFLWSFNNTDGTSIGGAGPSAPLPFSSPPSATVPVLDSRTIQEVFADGSGDSGDSGDGSGGGGGLDGEL